MVTSPSEDVAWIDFMTQPVRHADASRIAACFDGAVSPALSNGMRANPRLQDRFSALLQTHYKLDGWIDPQTLDPADRVIALAGLDVLGGLALRAGAIAWSTSIAGAVLAKAVNALQQQLGDDLVRFAMAQRDLGGPIQPLDPLESVGERIEEDGWRCLAAWCDAAPGDLGIRVRLKLPPGSIADQPAPAPFKDKGAAIIRRAAAA